MKVRAVTIVGTVLGIAVLVALIRTSKRDTEPTRLNGRPLHTEGTQGASAKIRAEDTRVQELSENRHQPAPLVSSEPSAHSSTNIDKKAQTKPARPKKVLKDPLAREALSLVGEDANAEAYWYAAINDPDIGPEERKDLIEDLNEDGLSDPKHPTNEDLPLIISRIELLELVGPSAMDQVNWDAFQEAYKDLFNLAELVLGGGEPVR